MPTARHIHSPKPSKSLFSPDIQKAPEWSADQYFSGHKNKPKKG
jgi:hypothetical protein